MTMDDICRDVNCKFVTWSNGGGDSCTAWLECKLKNCITDPNECCRCNNRIPKRGESS